MTNCMSKKLGYHTEEERKFTQRSTNFLLQSAVFEMPVEGIRSKDFPKLEQVNFMKGLEFFFHCNVAFYGLKHSTRVPLGGVEYYDCSNSDSSRDEFFKAFVSEEDIFFDTMPVLQCILHYICRILSSELKVEYMNLYLKNKKVLRANAVRDDFEMLEKYFWKMQPHLSLHDIRYPSHCCGIYEPASQDKSDENMEIGAAYENVDIQSECEQLCPLELTACNFSEQNQKVPEKIDATCLHSMGIKNIQKQDAMFEINLLTLGSLVDLSNALRESLFKCFKPSILIIGCEEPLNVVILYTLLSDLSQKKFSITVLERDPHRSEALQTIANHFSLRINVRQIDFLDFPIFEQKYDALLTWITGAINSFFAMKIALFRLRSATVVYATSCVSKNAKSNLLQAVGSKVANVLTTSNKIIIMEMCTKKSKVERSNIEPFDRGNYDIGDDDSKEKNNAKDSRVTHDRKKQASIKSLFRFLTIVDDLERITEALLIAAVVEIKKDLNFLPESKFWAGCLKNTFFKNITSCNVNFFGQDFSVRFCQAASDEFSNMLQNWVENKKICTDQEFASGIAIVVAKFQSIQKILILEAEEKLKHFNILMDTKNKNFFHKRINTYEVRQGRSNVTAEVPVPAKVFEYLVARIIPDDCLKQLADAGILLHDKKSKTFRYVGEYSYDDGATECSTVVTKSCRHMSAVLSGKKYLEAMKSKTIQVVFNLSSDNSDSDSEAEEGSDLINTNEFEECIQEVKDLYDTALSNAKKFVEYVDLPYGRRLFSHVKVIHNLI
jgi:hypothetical protein